MSEHEHDYGQWEPIRDDELKAIGGAPIERKKIEVIYKQEEIQQQLDVLQQELVIAEKVLKDTYAELNSLKDGYRLDMPLEERKEIDQKIENCEAGLESIERSVADLRGRMKARKILARDKAESSFTDEDLETTPDSEKPQ